MVKAISSDEVLVHVCDNSFFDEIIISLNELIVKNFDGKKAVIYVPQLRKSLIKNFAFPKRKSLEFNLQKIKSLFGDSGWVVEYYYGGYNEYGPEPTTIWDLLTGGYIHPSLVFTKKVI